MDSQISTKFPHQSRFIELMEPQLHYDDERDENDLLQEDNLDGIGSALVTEDLTNTVMIPSCHRQESSAIS